VSGGGLLMPKIKLKRIRSTFFKSFFIFKNRSSCCIRGLVILLPVTIRKLRILRFWKNRKKRNMLGCRKKKKIGKS
jgi:hypothetical protein